MSSHLKTQFLNYMTVQRFSHHTKRSYVTGVKLLAKYYMQSPDTLNDDQIQDYIPICEDRNCWGTVTFICPALSAFTGYCKWDDARFKSARPRVKKLPVVEPARSKTVACCN